jgi:hypothetical protein
MTPINRRDFLRSAPAPLALGAAGDRAVARAVEAHHAAQRRSEEAQRGIDAMWRGPGTVTREADAAATAVFLAAVAAEERLVCALLGRPVPAAHTRLWPGCGAFHRGRLYLALPDLDCDLDEEEGKDYGSPLWRTHLHIVEVSNLRTES